MQKKLIALAIAGLSSTAFAQSNVTISGVLKGGWDSTKISGSNAPAATNLNGRQNLIADQASSFVLSGSEALGNGLSAIFRIDNRFGIDGVDNVSNLATGNTHLGLKSANFGEIKFGTQDLHYNEIERIENGSKSLSQQAMVGRSLLNRIGNLNIGAGATRSKNVVFWDSPNWSGFTARVAYSTNPLATEGATGPGNADKGSAWNAVGRYENGPIKAGLSYYKQTAENGVAPTLVQVTTAVVGAPGSLSSDQTSTRAWLGYTIAGFSLGLAYDQSKVESAAGDAKRTGWAIPLSYSFGSHGVYATYAKADDIKAAGTKLDQTGAKQWTVGYSYDLSKRTSVGVNYTKIDNDSNINYNFANLKGTAINAANLGATTSQLYAGVRHAF